MRHTAAAAVIGAAALLVTACGGASPGGTPKSVTVGDRQSSGSTPASNRAATEAEAQRLLSLAELPPGASPTGNRPKELSGPAVGTPSDGNLIDKVGYWHVDESLDAAFRWIAAHRPKGLTKSGTAAGGGPAGETDRGIAWSEPDRDYATELQLEESATSDRSGAVVRVDGVGIWLDPRPYRDDRSGPRMRVSVASGCPKSRGRAVVGVTNVGSDLDQTLLPAPRPTAGLVCQFGGGNAKPAKPVFGLAGSVRLSAMDAHRLAKQVSRLPLDHTGVGVRHCPMDDGGVVVVALSYPGRPDVDLWWAATGCQYVSNGHIRVDGGLVLTRWIARSVGPL